MTALAAGLPGKATHLPDAKRRGTLCGRPLSNVLTATSGNPSCEVCRRVRRRLARAQRAVALPVAPGEPRWTPREIQTDRAWVRAEGWRVKHGDLHYAVPRTKKTLCGMERDAILVRYRGGVTCMVCRRALGLAGATGSKVAKIGHIRSGKRGVTLCGLPVKHAVVAATRDLVSCKACLRSASYPAPPAPAPTSGWDPNTMEVPAHLRREPPQITTPTTPGPVHAMDVRVGQGEWTLCRAKTALVSWTRVYPDASCPTCLAEAKRRRLNRAVAHAETAEQRRAEHARIERIRLKAAARTRLVPGPICLPPLPIVPPLGVPWRRRVRDLVAITHGSTP